MVKKQSYKVSDTLIKFLIESSNGFIGIDFLEELFSAIENEAENYHFTNLSEANLIRIISAVFNIKSFLRELITYPHHLEITIAIAASSNYLTDITVRNPETLYQLFNQNYLEKRLTRESLTKSIEETNHKFKSFNSKANMLRSIKSKNTLAIGLRDILKYSTLKETVSEISITASTILSALFEISYRSVLSKYNINSTRRKYCLVSLGKLGGRELNYSSDVDLIIFFDKSAKVGAQRKIEYYEILNESVQLFIKTASELTANGFLYRIDFRLRPDGRNAPLSRTIADYERYYETRGEDWERQMLIKLDFLCGSKELFDTFQNYVAHYVYPSSFSTSPFEQIRKMKTNIERRLSKDSNIKLFSGGIRDVEFAVQALQLINGGRKKELQTGNTLTAIEKLSKQKLLQSNEVERLSDAYIFYRKIEHFLQLLNDVQTHSIPEDKETILMLIKYLSINSIKSFQTILNKHRKNVRKIFNDITGFKSTNTFQNGFNIELFKNKQRAKSNIKYLSEGNDLTGQNKSDKVRVDLFQNLIPTIQHYLQKSEQPDRVLENFTKLISSVTIVSIWYREFADKKYFQKVLAICEYSELSLELMSAYRELPELLLTRHGFIKDIEPLFMYLTNRSLLLMLSIQYSLGLINNSNVSEILFKYIKFKINVIVQSLNFKEKYFVAGLGSLGSKSMSFKSDVDLIFIVKNFDNYESVQNKFQLLLNKIKTDFPMFEVDCRLRPEGNKSPLVWDLKSYEAYTKNRARIWEFQSLLKAELISGNEKLYADFTRLIGAEMKKLSLEKVKTEMISMIKTLRGKHNSIFLGTIDIKNGWGGLTYINFIVSYMQIKNLSFVKKLNKKSLLEKIKYLSRYSEQKEIFTQLKSNYIFLKNVEFSLQNCLNKRNSILPKNEEELKLLAGFLHIENERKLVNEVSNITKSNNEIFNIVLNGKN